MAGLDKDSFFKAMEVQGLALTYDDVRMRTGSGPRDDDGNLIELPEQIDIESRFSQHVDLKVPFVSAAMDTVTSGEMAIAMAKLGGLGVIHAAMSVEQQRREVRRVKMDINGLIEKPITVREEESLLAVQQMCDENRFDFRTFPVINNEGKFIGLLTGKDFEYPDSLADAAGRAMTPALEVTTAPVGTTLEAAFHLMQKKKITTLPILSEDGQVEGMYLFSDVSRIFRDSVQYNVDADGRLRTAAAVSTGPSAIERIEGMQKYLDVVVLDTADGDSYYAFKTLKEIKDTFPHLDVVVGNISEGASARELAEAGADGIKVGQGPGSICTTRRETGIGMPQVTAIYETVKALGKDFAHIPVCADGGIKNHGDISIAFAAGAHSVMMGRMLAGTKEAPGEVVTRRDGSKWKLYRGMGSPSALMENAASRERYGATGTKVFLAEGVESQVPFEGYVEDVLGLCIQALRKSMRYVKAPDIEHHRNKTRLFRITNQGLNESHPHSVDVITY